MYAPKEWKNHIVEHPNRYKMTEGESSGLVYLTPAPGEISQQGTSQSAQNFNHMEQGIYEVTAIVERIIADERGDLDTLKKIADALDRKISVTEGKGLSSNDYTDAEKNKLSGITAGATKNTAASTAPKAAGTAAVGTETGYARGDHVHPAQTSVTGNAGTATKLATARIINGMLFDGNADRTNYAVCSTAAATAAKTVACAGFELVTGAEITVFFTTTNTATNPTLNVNNTGAKPIYYRGAAIAAGYLAANRIYTFRCTGSAYSLVGDIDTNTTYVNMTAATASAAGKAGLVPAPAAGKQASFLRGDGAWATPTNTTYSNATTTAAGLMSAADKGKLNSMSLPVCYQGSLASGTVTKALPSGKTKCLLIASKATSNGMDCGAYVFTDLSGSMSAVSHKPLWSSGSFTLLYSISAAGAITLETPGIDYTMIYFN